MLKQSLFALKQSLPVLAGGLFASIVLSGAAANAADSLWFGNDGAGVDFHTTLNGTVIGTINESLTGAAWDGSNLFVGDPGVTIEKKTLAGAALPGTFTIPALGSPAEDMAWDSKRQDLVRVFHIGSGNQGYVEVFSRSGTVVASAALPTVDPTGTLTGTMGALGVAYDSRRDQYDISFCNEGCGAIGGVVEAFDPTTLSFVSTIFTSSTQYLGGLGYQRGNDTLWVGGADSGGFFVEHFLRNGTILSRFGSAVFPDGMEFIAVPEPATWASLLLGFGLLGLAARRRRATAA
jgi:hypothetical protein